MIKTSWSPDVVADLVNMHGCDVETELIGMMSKEVARRMDAMGRWAFDEATDSVARNMVWDFIRRSWYAVSSYYNDVEMVYEEVFCEDGRIISGHVVAIDGITQASVEWSAPEAVMVHRPDGHSDRIVISDPDSHHQVARALEQALYR